MYSKSLTALFILLIMVFGPSNLFAKATAESGIDVVLVMDSSGSMKKTDPLSLRIPAAKLFISLLGDNDRAGIVSFSNKGYPVVPLTPVSSKAGKDRLFQAAEKISSTGLYTNLHDALRSGLSVLSQDMPSDRTRFIILMSDGMMDVGSPDKDLRLIKEIKQILSSQLENQGVKVYTIAFTEQADTHLLEKLSKRTGGFYNLALTDRDFHLIFTSIFESLKRPEKLPMEENGFLIDSSVDEVTIVATKGSPETHIQIDSPDGQQYSHMTGATGVEWFASDNFDMITVQKPAAGKWDILFSTGENNSAYIITDLKLKTNFDQLYSTFGDPIDIHIWLEKDGTRISDQSLLEKFDIHIEMTGPDGETSRLDSFSKGEGVFVRKVAPFTPGNYKLRIVARGNTFEREKAFVFNIADARESKEDVLVQREKDKKARAEAVQEPPGNADNEDKISWAKAIIQFICINLLLGIIILLFLKRKSLMDKKGLKEFLPSIKTAGERALFNVKRFILRKKIDEPNDQPEKQEEKHGRQERVDPEEPEPQQLDVTAEEVKGQNDQVPEEDLTAQEAGEEQKPELPQQQESANTEEPVMSAESKDAQQVQDSEEKLTGEDAGETLEPEATAEHADADASAHEETEAAESETGEHSADLNTEVKGEEDRATGEAESSAKEVQADSNEGILNQDALDELLKADTRQEDAAASEDTEDTLSSAPPEQEEDRETEEKTVNQDNIDDMWAEALQAQKEAESGDPSPETTDDAIEAESDSQGQSEESAEQEMKLEDKEQNTQQDNIDDMWQEALQAQKEAESETAEPDNTAAVNEAGNNEVKPQEQAEQQIKDDDKGKSSEQDNIDDMWQEALQAEKKANEKTTVSQIQSEANADTEPSPSAGEENDVHEEGASSD